MSTFKKVCLSGLIVLCAARGWCNTDSRHWTLEASGETSFAALVKYDIEQDVVVLRFNDGEDKTYSIEDFSVIDGAWLLEWVQVSAELDALGAQMKSEFSHYQHKGEYTADVYYYIPSQGKENTQLPLLFMFHPTGKGARGVKRMMQAAEQVGVIIMSSDSFFNTHDDEANKRMMPLFKELLPELETIVPHDKNRVILGGSSGGASRAFRYTRSLDRPFLGVFSVCGWLGGEKNYHLKYPSGMRVAMVNGDSDRAANAWIKGDTAVLESNGCQVNLFAFEGGHQFPPVLSQIEALDWLVNGDAGEPSPQP